MTEPLTVSAMQITVAFYAALGVATRWITIRAPGWLADILNMLAEWVLWITCVYSLGYMSLANQQSAALIWFDAAAGAVAFGVLTVLSLTRVASAFVSARLASVGDEEWFAPLVARVMQSAEQDSSPASGEDRRDEQVVQRQPDQERAANAYANK